MILLAIIGVGAVVVIASIVAYQFVQQVYAQVTDSPFANCIIMSMKDIQVVLGTDEDCNSELFAQAVSYYKSQGYKEASYSNVLGEQTIALDK
jgi:hypothetical protein